ncbi:Crp/Fnr family transcriptional regulator [Aerococcus sanguinicola]|uniref:Crp/Fnr family transcriptional regulator n=1 Tax=unclassified Aerococcus TaxID=2618060 RepID=UPI0008A42AF6|nr:MULTISPECIES: Crp/Fnr family transcriptional regulator [unclassified Aerococcus]MDK6232745.1 Crp/Fnr family transcriptional regulator [Aerococcus sp. UMB10185]MDK6854965.1 Crp/Fnr family transcriptional regulator [Aerococcus sp. UMB7533]MDK8501769.1 Crp/Fnr family transcriptional regulator [Aerococcus sp. UMB1112A]OFN02723.1 Crp/Fnr family transcriptional regulator [Aerococcus sp. HMSC062A02]OHO45608.1 Crp/Fnr family transcriptional regulator [Aerococcus sp. HMSC035B07]
MYYKELANFSLFQNVSKESVDLINAMNIRVKNFKVGERVNFLGDPIQYIYVIASGCLKTNEYLMNGKEIVSSYYFGYDAFPLYLIYGGATTYPYNIYCHKQAQVYCLPVEELKACIDADPKLMSNVLVFVSKYCLKNKKVIQTASYPKVSQRLAFWLLTSSDQRDNFRIPGTQELFSDILLVNRSSLNQELKRLTNNGIISIYGRRIHINDRSALNRILENA